MNRWNVVACMLAFTLLAQTAHAALITDATTLWTPVIYPGANQYDYFDDQQTGNASSSSDIVGNPTNPSLYTRFDDGGTLLNRTDGTMMFRARLGSPGGSGTPEFDRNLFVGIDANQDGRIDLYVGVNNQGSFDRLAIYDPGAGLNNSPSTTTIVSPPVLTYAETNNVNYLYTTVDTTATDLDADGNTDYFLSFALPFNAIVSQLAAFGVSGVTDLTPFSYVLATATQDNSFNQDINGLPKTYDSSMTWTQLGAISTPVSISGSIPSPVPEPGSLAVAGILAACAFVRSRKQRVPGVADQTGTGDTPQA